MGFLGKKGVKTCSLSRNFCMVPAFGIWLSPLDTIAGCIDSRHVCLQKFIYQYPLPAGNARVKSQFEIGQKAAGDDCKVCRKLAVVGESDTA